KSEAPSHIQSSKWRALENLVEYAEGGECRHSEILTYYQDSQRLQHCGHCDVCLPSSARRIARPASALSGVKKALKKVWLKKGAASADPYALTPEEARILEILRMWRREKARELDVPAFVVFSDRTLRDLAQTRPRDREDLEDIHGMG